MQSRFLAMALCPLLLTTMLRAQTTAPAARTFTGTVVDEAGRPVPNATISCDYGRIHATTIAAPDGAFTLGFPMPSAASFSVPLIAFAPDHATLAFQFYTPPTAGHPTAPARLTVRPARRLPVTVSDAGHHPIAGAAIIAGRPAMPIARTTTDAAGKAVLLLPADAPIDFIIASKAAAGFDFVTLPAATDHPGPATLPATVAVMLAGAAQLTVHVIDEDNHPVAGAAVHPASINFMDKPLFFPSLPDFTRTTDAAGNATFDFLPANAKGVSLTVTADAHTTAQTPFDPARSGKLLTITLFRKVPLAGHVRDVNGHTVAGATVFANGNDGGNSPVDVTAATAADGSFSLLLDPDKYYLFLATKDPAISSPVTALIRHQPPSQPLDLTLGDGVHVRGHLTAGPANTPVPNISVGLNFEDFSYSRLPADARLPPHPGRDDPVLSFNRTVTTASQGAYDFISVPGAHVLITHINGHPVFKQVEVPPVGAVADLHALEPVDAPKTFSGRAVLADNPEKPVPNVLLEPTLLAGNAYVDPFDPAGEDGAFTEKHVPVDFYLHARSPDGKLAGIVRLTPRDDNITLPLSPAVNAAGRLVDADKKALPNVTLYLSAPHLPRDHITESFARTATTDANGNFSFNGLIPGYNYTLSLLDGNRFSKTITIIVPKKPGDLPLGNLPSP
jgi:hypothetical protein